MSAHCRACSPEEACGILAGTGSEISRVYPMTNVEHSPVSYFIDPQEQFRVMKEIRQSGLVMVGIYHSHPSSPAFPSAKDMRLAFYEDAVYVIVSLSGEGPVVKGYGIRDNAVSEVRIEVRE